MRKHNVADLLDGGSRNTRILVPGDPRHATVCNVWVHTHLRLTSATGMFDENMRTART